jgi:hypothetical protein
MLNILVLYDQWTFKFLHQLEEVGRKTIKPTRERWNAYGVLVRKPEGKRPLGRSRHDDDDDDDELDLKKKNGMRAYTEFIRLKEWLVVVQCEHSYDFSTLMNHLKFLDCLNHYHLLKNDCVLWFCLVRWRFHSGNGRLSLADTSNFMPTSSYWLRFWQQSHSVTANTPGTYKFHTEDVRINILQSAHPGSESDTPYQCYLKHVCLRLTCFITLSSIFLSTAGTTFLR